MRKRSPGLHLLALLALVTLAACGSDSDPVAAAASYPATPRTVFGGNRPVTIQVPTTYKADHSAPLMVILHGYGANGQFQEQYLGLSYLVETDGVLIIAPDGTLDSRGSLFWNATPACCNFDGSHVDDVAYIRGLIADIRRDYNVDQRRIYVVGHSNGAFMAHRLACDAAPDIAAIVSLAGATFESAADCKPAEPISVLDIHGDADDTVHYEGGQIGAPYPSELETMTHWQVYDHCAADLVTDPTMLDLDFGLHGNESSVQRFENCARGTGVELWTIHGGGHIPELTHAFRADLWQWLSAHPKQ